MKRPRLHHLVATPLFTPLRGSSPRVLLYSHDTFGLGHLRRNLAIAAHLLRRSQSFSASLLTGSPVAASWPMPAGLEVETFPPVVKTGAEEYVSRDGFSSFATVKACREAIILEGVIRYRPDVFLVDHAPAGMKGELRKVLAFIREEMRATQTVLGLRDIIDSPEAVRSLWREQNIYQLLETAYDQILVYGCRHLFDSVRAYDFPAAVAAKTRYCGYIARNDSNVQAANRLRMAPTASGRPVILVTVGGGGDGYPLLSAYLRALDCIPHNVAQSIIVPGPLMAIEERRALELAAVRRPNVRMIFFITELAELIRSANLVVAMAGYNTTVEILVAKKPAILVPRVAPRMEQLMRAKLLSNLGLAWVIQPEENLVTRLAELIQGALAGARPPCNCCNAVDLEGVHRVGDILDDLLGRRTPPTGQRNTI
jgi:predicted glycosyltransferase